MSSSGSGNSMHAFVLDDQGQRDLLQEALRHVQEHGFRMKRAIDAQELSNVLKHAADVLRELRTSLLSPKNYYQLYMQVMDELRDLEAYFVELSRSGTPVRTLYERVQSSGNVLPRLYLLVTVGSVYIQSKEAPAKEVLIDLVEMTKSVQYPLRGLFLRHYLSICVKDKLPDVGSPYEGHGGCSDDAIGFLLQNLREMNRLWIRMQHQKTGPLAAKDKAAREKERQELQLLVGTNLVRLSQMEGVNAAMYSSHVLPSLLDMIVSCKDRIAQFYLMECIVQVFPDEYHLHSLERFLQAFGELHEMVDTPAILRGLLDRLTKYYEANQHDPIQSAAHAEAVSDEIATIRKKQQQVLTLVLACVKKLAMPALPDQKASVLALLVSSVTFTIRGLGKNPEFVRRALQQSVDYLQEQLHWNGSTSAAESDDMVPYLHEMAKTVIQSLPLRELMEIENLSQLVALVPVKARREIAMHFVHALLNRHEHISNAQEAKYVMETLRPLIRDECVDASMAAYDENPEEKHTFEEQQMTLSKIVQRIHSTDLDVQFEMFKVARRAFGQGGVARIRFTLVPLVYRCLQLTRELVKDEAKDPREYKTTARVVLQFVHEMATALASKLEQMTVAAVHLFLQCALVADGCSFESIAYEFITQAFIVYEDQISHSREQWQAIELMVASLRATSHLTPSNYETLATKTTQYAAKLLKKQDQGLMVLRCAHLFWNPIIRDGKRVLECLQRSLRIADACGHSTTATVALFLEILEAYLYFFQHDVAEVTLQYLHGLVALVKEHLENMEHGSSRHEGEMRYRLIVRAMESSSLPQKQF